MNKSEQEILENLEQSYADFIVPLRMGEGLKEEAFDKFCEVLVECRSLWRNQERIPKLAVNIFVDAYIAFLGASEQYQSLEADKFEIQADKMQDLIRSCIEVE
mgnify:CR=1 FL=1